ncbi:MAG: beta-propeller domain-containing protein [Patescibacteria group bacterium]|nr:beta-propeller domain-containing protein [Patescibacteria group bacterium]
MNPMLQKPISTKIGLLILAGILLICGGILIYAASTGDLKIAFDQTIVGKKLNDLSDGNKGDLSTIKKFSSANEFKDFIAKHSEQSNPGYYGMGRAEMGVAVPTMARDVAVSDKAVGTQSSAEGSGLTAGRVSETNVQVAGIDEPDIVKTDGKEIYVSALGGYYPLYRGGGGVTTMMAPAMEKAIAPYPYYDNSGVTKMISALPPESMKENGKLDKGGNLLLMGDILMVFTNDNKIYAYDVANKAEPKEKWTLKFGEREQLVGARLMDGKLYLATAGTINQNVPCPIVPMTVGAKEVTIACTDIYYPSAVSYTDVTYNLVALNAVTGETVGKTSFVGSINDSVFYMSENAIYLTYQNETDLVSFAYNFFSENKDLVGDWVVDKLNKLRSYDLSQSTKNQEMYQIINKYQQSLGADEQLRVQNEMSNRMDKFMEAHRRDLAQTGIVKIGLKNMSVTAAGQVPGKPLNQFSLDEFENHLRIAVTVGEGWWGFGGWGGQQKTISDVYALDEKLNTVGSVKDLGEGERIYSARFIGDRGYVVTFRQTDPFYVLDLGNPRQPVLRGELKIPGYSSYLHPLGEHQVLGIGKEGSQVKISIFDASVPEDPKEVSKYTLNEYWSEALNNHHAFLLDKKHQVFFLPGSQGGYVFSYVKDSLSLVKAISGVNVQRAIYLDDYMYLIGTDKITVLNEKNWEKVKEFDL